jgi:hypothetical protein
VSSVLACITLSPFLFVSSLKKPLYIPPSPPPHIPLQINVCSAQERLDYLLSIGLKTLSQEVGINGKYTCKVVRLSPQILVQRIEISWNARYLFLSKDLGASRDSVVKHPQLLHYSIDDGFVPMINFLRSIGMRNSDFLEVLTSLTG